MVWTPAVVFIAQFVTTVLVGLAIPLCIAVQWWRHSNHTTIPFIQSAILAGLSLFLMVIFPMPLIGMGFAYLGNSPNSSIGITVGWALVALIYWPVLKRLFSHLKKRKRI